MNVFDWLLGASVVFGLGGSLVWMVADTNTRKANERIECERIATGMRADTWAIAGFGLCTVITDGVATEIRVRG